MDVAFEKQGNKMFVRLAGRFDVKSTSTFRNAVKPLLADMDVANMTIDFDRVPFIDSSGLGMLLLLREQAREAKKNLVLTRCGPDLQRVLSVAQFPRLFHIE